MSQVVSSMWKEDEFRKLVNTYIEKRVKDIVHQECVKAQEEVRIRIEKEALRISLQMAQMYRIEDGGDQITISVIKKKN